MFRSLKKKVSGALHQPRQGDSLTSTSRWSFSTASFGNNTSKTSNDEARPPSFRVLDRVVETTTTTAQLPLQPETLTTSSTTNTIPEPPPYTPLPETLPENIEPEAVETQTEIFTDPSSPRYVPYVDAVPVNTMFASSSTTNAGMASFYGRVNPAIMGGFGDDEEPQGTYEDSIILNDDEETDEEAVVQVLTPTSDHEDEVSGPAEPTAAREATQPAFHYRAISDDIMADFDFSPPATVVTEPETQSTITPPGTSLSTVEPRRGYLPVSDSILQDFDFSAPASQTTATTASPAIATTSPTRTSSISVGPPSSRPTSSTSVSNNPYVALFEQKDQAMTLAFLRSQESPGSRSNGGDLAADDFSFGQRYQKAADTTDVVVTRQRLTADDLSGVRECPICAETKEVTMFPVFSVTPTCTHPPATCLECLQMSIQSDLSSKLWTDIRCPECREFLDYVDIQKYADKQTFARYEALALRAAMSEASNFIWCTSGCGSGQIHDTGSDQPIVNCLHCSQRSCFVHNVAWHENLTCREYDQLIADPENFRSQIEIENEEWETLRRVQEDADRAMAQGLEAEQQAEIARREAREREERERTRKAADLARKIAARRKKEEEQSTATVAKTTKPCPGCGWAIEKNDGCSHMTCAKCKHQFCYECGADHKDIVLHDNSIHKEDCKFHPSNLEDEDWTDGSDSD